MSTMVHSLRQHRHQAARGRAPSPRLGRTRESALVPTPPRDRLRPAAFLADRARWWNRCVEPTRTCFASSGCTPRSLRLCPVSRGSVAADGSEPQRWRCVLEGGRARESPSSDDRGESPACAPSWSSAISRAPSSCVTLRSRSAASTSSSAACPRTSCSIWRVAMRRVMLPSCEKQERAQPRH